MKIKTYTLTDLALNWAVAKCEGVISGDDLDTGFIFERGYTPPTNWSQAGPIIERERIAVWPVADCWVACTLTGAGYDVKAPTSLVAAMRCYVASKMGDEVDVPEALL